MNTIIAENIKTQRTSNVWLVSIKGTEEHSYCKSARTAMKFMFLLKKRTGARIEDESLKSLSAAIREQRLAEHPEQAEAAAKIQEVVEEFAESHSVDNVLSQPTISDEECERLGINPVIANAVFLPSEPATEEPAKPATKRRGRPRKNKTTEEAA